MLQCGSINQRGWIAVVQGLHQQDFVSDVPQREPLGCKDSSGLGGMAMRSVPRLVKLGSLATPAEASTSPDKARDLFREVQL
jgi:hypothetical protein